MKKILIIGLPGELGKGCYEVQIGNSAIMIPLLKHLKNNMPDAKILSNIQFSDEFCENYGVQRAPYAKTVLRHGAVWQMVVSFINKLRTRLWRFIWDTFNLNLKWLIYGKKLQTFINSDVILDFNGDIFPTDIINPARALKQVFDIQTINNLGVPLLELASSPGPFKTRFHKWISKAMYGKMSAILNRESVSSGLLRELGIKKTPIIDTACPAFLLKPAPPSQGKALLLAEGINKEKGPLVGISVCGYNFPGRSWKIKNFSVLESWIPTLKYLLEEIHATVFFVPHANYKNPYIGLQEPVHGYDYEISVALCKMAGGPKYNDKIKVIEGIYSPQETKSIIGQCDMYITGRMHAGVGALSQSVPTVLVAYGHKHQGIARLVGQEKYVFQGNDADAMKILVRDAWENKEKIVRIIGDNMVKVRKLCDLTFNIVKDAANLPKKTKGRIPEQMLNEWIKKKAEI